MYYILWMIIIYSELREIVIPLGYKRWFRSLFVVAIHRNDLILGRENLWSIFTQLGCTDPVVNWLQCPAVRGCVGSMYIYIYIHIYIYICVYILYIYIHKYKYTYIYIYNIYISISVYPWYHRKSSAWFSHVDWFYPRMILAGKLCCARSRSVAAQLFSVAAQWIRSDGGDELGITRHILSHHHSG